MIRAWIKRQIKKLVTLKKRPAASAVKTWPTREQIAQLPFFESLALADIKVIHTDAGAHQAFHELKNAGVVGFDTESKPTFVKGHVSTGPHVVQFSTLKKAYVFMLYHAETRKMASALIALPGLKKVGFGLRDDVKRIVAKLQVQPQSVLDLETEYKARGYGAGVGVKVAIALTFKRQFRKSRRASTSNWKRVPLSESQLIYAANDAYAAMRVAHALKIDQKPNP